MLSKNNKISLKRYSTKFIDPKVISINFTLERLFI